jgi:hypothetical protein
MSASRARVRALNQRIAGSTPIANWDPTSVRPNHTCVQWRQPALGATNQVDAARRNAKQWNRTREPAVARQGRRRNARRPFLLIERRADFLAIVPLQNTVSIVDLQNQAGDCSGISRKIRRISVLRQQPSFSEGRLW